MPYWRLKSVSPVSMVFSLRAHAPGPEGCIEERPTGHRPYNDVPIPVLENRRMVFLLLRFVSYNVWMPGFEVHFSIYVRSCRCCILQYSFNSIPRSAFDLFVPVLPRSDQRSITISSQQNSPRTAGGDNERRPGRGSMSAMGIMVWSAAGSQRE